MESGKERECLSMVLDLGVTGLLDTKEALDDFCRISGVMVLSGSPELPGSEEDLSP